MSVVEGREEIKNLFNLPDAAVDDVSREGDVADGCAEKDEAGIRGGRDLALQGISGVDFRWQKVSDAAPDERLLQIDVETDFLSP